MTHIVTIGADPEFAFLDENARFVPADLALRNYSVADDEIIGKDGGQRAAELRPAASTKVEDVVNNLKNAMQKGLEKRPYLYNLFWKAGSFVVCEPIGGHIHIGVSDTYGRVPLVSRELKALGRALSKTVGVVGVYLENDKEQIYRRTNSNYGSFFGEDSLRYPQYGIEWRSLGSWLTSPGIASGILSMAGLVANAYVNNLAIRKTLNDMESPTEACMSLADKVTLKPYMQEAVKVMKTMDGWTECKNQLREVVHCLAEGKDWGSDQNMVESWNLSRPNPPVQGVA